MREIKFKYIFKRKFDDRLYGEIYQIALFEEAITNPPNPVTGMLNNNKWGIIARLEYTGLKSKSGVEIYEGDVIKRNKSIGFIKFAFGGFKIDWQQGTQYTDWVLSSHNENSSIIGNIYETPELLKGN